MHIPEAFLWVVGLDLTAVENNSVDNPSEVVRKCQTNFKLDLRYLFERRQGKSRALNTGIWNADADLVGLIDDDVDVAKGSDERGRY